MISELENRIQAQEEQGVKDKWPIEELRKEAKEKREKVTKVKAFSKQVSRPSSE